MAEAISTFVRGSLGDALHWCRGVFLGSIEGIHRSSPKVRAVDTLEAYVAIKTDQGQQTTTSLEGEDAQRLIEYMENPTPPEGHDEFLRKSDETFRELYSSDSADEIFH
jgi:hypothetical protein